MADNVAKYGFRFYRSRYGTGTPTPERKFLASGYSGSSPGANVDVNIGDPVALTTDGTVIFATAGSAGGIYGVVVGIDRYWDGTRMRSGNKVPYASGVYGTNYDRQTAIYVLRAEDCIFEVDCDDAVSATTYATYLACVGENADLAYTTASATTGLANPKLDISTHAVTATLQLRIEGISDTMWNQDFSGANVKMLVTVNKTQAATQAATTIVGV